jgi:uncharacterized protein (DUF2336 family)
MSPSHQESREERAPPASPHDLGLLSAVLDALPDEPELDIEAARVRAGASPGTSARTLLSLAADPSVTVRAAVALNRAAPADADRLLATDGDERVRTLIARKLASLIPELPADRRDHIRGQALRTLEHLVADEAERVRAAIADAVKELPSAPRELILRLARDSAMSVCDPVIRLSPLLTAEDLLSLLDAPPSPAAILAVARRPNLDDSVSDAIVAAENVETIAALLHNPSASIRESTLDVLIARAVEVTIWQLPLVRRPRLSARAARALSEIVSNQLLEALVRRADLDPAVSGELRARLDRRLKEAALPAAQEPTMEEAMIEARVAFAEGRLDEDALLGAVRRGEARLATALLAVAADLPGSVVDRAATLRSAKGLVSLLWKAGFSMRVAGPVQTLLARLAPENVLRASPTGGFPLAVEEMRWQLDFLARMGR